MSTSAHVLTHFKEKLQFVAAENAGLKNTLAEREVQLVGRRDQLTSIKQARDALRMDNAGMKSTRPLVSSEELLLDFERRKVRRHTRTTLPRPFARMRCRANGCKVDILVLSSAALLCAVFLDFVACRAHGVLMRTFASRVLCNCTSATHRHGNAQQKLQQRKVTLDALQARYGDITSQMRQQRSATNAVIR